MQEIPDNIDLDAVYREYANLVYRFLYAHIHDAEWAQELMQETFLRAIDSINRYDGSCKLSTWLCQIARHIMYQELRKKNRAELVELEPPTGRKTSSAGNAGWNCTGRSIICRKQSGKSFYTALRRNSPSGKSARSSERTKTGAEQPSTEQNRKSKRS